ncbi:CSC1-like protein HYP1 [Rhizoctonia solani]|uniref:CSC1-like protein HYP1 n=1 Tax=Rhizoctonia solani TaxID=456999 RepID=A0A0K6GES8_9AGAM|nr:CSC1-like protein HYP1 [Rhizoctonia solani]
MLKGPNDLGAGRIGPMDTLDSLYMARCWAVTPSPLQPKWPLTWIWQVLRTNDETFLRLSGVDATVYTRFLRACFYFAALHTCTTLLVILPIHYLLAPPEIKKSDINRGSVTTLVSGLPDERADKILWVHMGMVIWITISWMLFLTWFVLGSLRYRAYAARHVHAPVTSRIGSPHPPSPPATNLHPDSAGGGSSFPSTAYTTGTLLLPSHPEPAPVRSHTANDGSGPDYSLRCRTVMVTNIPQNLRTPQMLRWYFGRYLPDGPTSEGTENKNQKGSGPWSKFKSTVRPTPSVRSPLDVKPKDKVKRSRVEGNRPNTQIFMAGELEMDPDQIEEVEARGQKLVENVVIAPKLSTLARLIAEREKRMEELEEAHIHLAQTIMAAVGTEIKTRQREEARKAREGDIRRRERLRADARSEEAPTSSLGGEDGGGLLGAIRDGATQLRISIERLALGWPDRSEAMDKLVQTIGPFVEEAWKRDAQYGVIPWFRSTFDRIRAKISRTPRQPIGDRTKDNGAGQNGHHPNGQSSQPNPANSPHKTVWEALYSIDPNDLRHYHPLTRKRSILLYPLELIGILTPTGLPVVDLAFRRIRSIQEQIEKIKCAPLPDASEKTRKRGSFIEEQDEMDSSDKNVHNHTDSPPQPIEPASSAFITFRRWEDARRATRTLSHRPGKPLTCLVVMAPQSTDLDWERLVKGKFAAQFVRDWVVGVAIWLFQIFWIFPISFITSLISIKSLEAAIPPLQKFFDDHHRARDLLTGLIPTLLVAGLGILIPVILFAIGRKGQTEIHPVANLLIYLGILVRYYKWLILNIVIFFCIGLASFQTFLNAFRKQIPDPFQLVSSSFPAAAPFYAGWFILQTSLQNLMQYGLVGLPLITYIWGVRKASTPRKRKRGTQPRTIDYHYWTPNHLLGMHIIMIFAVLNPLVIPFGLIYYSVANVVFRNQLLRVYARRFYEGNGKMLTIRVLRYSMDGLALSHIVFLAFNLLNYNRARAGISGALFGLTLILKLLATREFRARYERLEHAESARLCGEEDLFLTSEERSSAGAPPKITGTMCDTPLPLERLDKFHSPPDAMGPSVTSWDFRGLKKVGRGYHAKPIPSHPLRGRHKAKSASLTQVVSRTNSQAEMMRPDSPTSVESVTGTAVHASSRLLAAPLGLVQQVGQVSDMIVQVPGMIVQVPGKLLDLVTSKPSHKDDWSGINYLGGAQPTNLIMPGPKLQRWDDTPNGSASYECPYYLDEGPRAIWLPRDPSGPIDLDDTVLMHRLLLSLHNQGASRSKDKNEGFTDKDQDVKMDVPQSDTPHPPVTRPPMSEHDSEKSVGPIPFTQSPMGTPDETPARATSHSTRASRPSIIRVRTTSPERITLGSTWGRQSASDSVEMKPLQTVSGGTIATSSMAATGATLAQPRIQRQPSLLSALRFGRGAESPNVGGPGSIYSYKTAADGGDSRQNSDKRKTRILPPEDIRKALDATVLAEEEAEKMRKAKEEQAEKLDDARVEQGESGGWSLVKKLVLKRNTEQ